ncbi:MAG: P-type conjugative transfer protein VirB9 [Alphaproteobacteria bacterium]|nr:P-type conjugative transfer protein VirB9 [Alphaproteobacteria bacterium]
MFLFVLRLICVVLILGASSKAWSLEENPKPVPTDARIRIYSYKPNQVYKFMGHYRFQSSIEFAPGETIETLTMGDPGGWQIEPLGNRIFLKPIDDYATTNMTVITNLRMYHFELYAEETEDIRDDNMVFVVRFVYPEYGIGGVKNYSISSTPEFNDTENYNFNYTVAGKEYISPIKIFDDGEFTYFQFREKNSEIPAFFLVNPDGSEELINYRMDHGYVVIERVASQFTLRQGSEILCVFNESRPLIKLTPVTKAGAR